jgi:carbamoyltransferase
MAILGISDSHNAAAALLTAEGGLRALQEERPRRIKNFFDTPREAIAWLLAEQGIAAADVEELALCNLNPFRPVDRDGTIRQFRAAGSLTARTRQFVRDVGFRRYVFARRRRRRLATYRALGFRPERIRSYEHHECHAATAFYGWGRHDAPVLIVTCDGAGDELCATVSVGQDGRIERRFSVDWSHSFGVLYAVVTYMTGMVPNEHEYKLMGMAPYASPSASERVKNKLLALFEWDGGGRPVWRRAAGVPHMALVQRRLERVFFEERFDAVMGGVQLFTEAMLAEFVRRAIATTGIRRVACAGGVFMNVKANKVLMEMAEVEELFVFPSCGDETTAIGAAWLAYAARHGGAQVPPLGSFYLGPEWSEAGLREALGPLAASGRITLEKPANINDAVVDCLARGKVVGRFAGREEFGARSLGNRAIIADPRNAEVIQVINAMVKSRDFWMPFASSVLAEAADDYLVNPKRVPAPHMILSFDTTPRGAEELRAGIHPYDRTCRPQVVTRAANPDYWDLIDRFRQKTGVGGVLNTSLNLHGLPLVHRPEDAIEVMEKSGLRILAMGPFLVTKGSATA